MYPPASSLVGPPAGEQDRSATPLRYTPRRNGRICDARPRADPRRADCARSRCKRFVLRKICGDGRRAPTRPRGRPLGWLSDHTRPFVIVLVETADQRDHPLGPFGHLGVACASREEINRLYAEACREGRPTRAPIDAGDPVGYTARIADPDGHSLELSFGQEVGLTVRSAAKG